MLYKLSPDNMFSGDSLIKLVQAQSLLENNFESEEVRCKNLSVLGNCKFLFDGFKVVNEKLIGPFPVFQSVFSAMFLMLGQASYIKIFSVFLFLLTIWKAMFRWKINSIVILHLFLCTPLFFHYIDFFDVALSITILCFGISYILEDENNEWKYLYSGILLGLSFWLRLEVLIFVAMLVGFTILIRFRFHTKKTLLLASPIFVLLLVYFAIQYFLYNNILGSRFLFNQSSIFNQELSTRINIIQSLLVYGNLRIGFWGYMFLFFPLLIYVLSKIKTIPENLQILSLSIFFSIVLIVFFAPNDSNIDWGSRYLSILIVPFGILLNYFLNKFKDRKWMWIIFIIASLYSIFISKMYYSTHIQLTKKVKEFREFFSKQNSDVWLFSNNSILQFVSVSYLEKPILLVKSENDISTLFQLLNRQDKYKTFSYFQINNILRNSKQEGVSVFVTNPTLESKLSKILSLTPSVKKDTNLLLDSHTIKISDLNQNTFSNSK